MKNFTTLLVFSFFTVFSIHAATWTVSNNPDIPGQFTQISEAIADASTSEGDTLLVAGSPIRYGDFTLNKKFVIIGAGMNNPHGHTTWVNRVTLATTPAFTPSGSYLSGLWIDYQFLLYTTEGSKTIEDVVIERSWVDYQVLFYGNAGSTYRNITIRNCIIEYYSVYFDPVGTLDNILIHNCLFDNAGIYQHASADLSNVTVKNNVFINETVGVFNPAKNLVVEDNIFFKALPQGCTGCTFTNNTAYGSLDNVLPGVNNLGSGNEIRDPKFVNYTDAHGAFSWAAGYDYHLTPASLDDDSGTGGGQRGMYGGPTPVELGSNPPIPQMTDISFTDNASSVKEEGTLKVKFKAKKQD